MKQSLALTLLRVYGFPGNGGQMRQFSRQSFPSKNKPNLILQHAEGEVLKEQS
jgi:hypothetical protein